MTPKSDFLLRMFFIGKVKELSLPILGEQLLDEHYKSILQHYEFVKKYIKVDTVEKQVLKECFDKYFIFENASNPIIKAHVIYSLKDITDFTSGYGGLFYKGESVNTWNWEKVVGGRQWECFPRAYAETVIYNGNRNSYEEARKNYQQYGITFWGGATVADYINSGLIALQPHVLEMISELESL